MAEYNYRKRTKHCVITVNIINSPSVRGLDFKDEEPDVMFEGTKNKVLHELKIYLKSADIVGSDLSDIMRKVNATTDIYNKDLVPFKPYRVDIVTFDEKVNLAYFITVKYFITKLKRVPIEGKLNLRGENIYEKRMLQGCTNNLLKRLEVANKAIDEIKLEEAIFKPFVEQVFKNVSINKDGTIPFNPPYETVIVVAPDIEVLVRWEVIYDTDVRIKIKVKSVLYRGKEICLEASSTTLSESYVAGIEYSVKELAEVCNSIKNHTRNNNKI